MAAVMTFVSKIENDSAVFYQNCAQTFPESQEVFQSWAKENKKFEKNTKRTYFGVITDTLESNFAFEGLQTDEFEFNSALPPNADFSECKRLALAIEDKIRQFYLTAAQSSEGLMADIPRLFKKIAKKREERQQSIESL